MIGQNGGWRQCSVAILNRTASAHWRLSSPETDYMFISAAAAGNDIKTTPNPRLLTQQTAVHFLVLFFITSVSSIKQHNENPIDLPNNLF